MLVTRIAHVSDTLIDDNTLNDAGLSFQRFGLNANILS